MKKKYKKPTIGLFPTKCHVGTLSSEEPKDINHERRNLLMRTGMVATVGQLTLLHASNSDVGPQDSSSTKQW